MKKIEAIIRKTKFEDVKEALLAAGPNLSWRDVRYEQYRACVDEHRGA